jgi:hypothetical protein
VGGAAIGSQLSSKLAWSVLEWRERIEEHKAYLNIRPRIKRKRKNQRQDVDRIHENHANVGDVQPCVVITPPSLRAPKSNSKYGFWNKLSAGPSGSDESVMITSNSFL